MKLKELEAHKIIIMALGVREGLKKEDEVAEILKKRLTKKERAVLNALVLENDKNEIYTKLNIDEERFNKIMQGATKKLKNESLHREFYK